MMFLRLILLSCCAGLLMLPGCTMPTADDTHGRGSSSAIFGKSPDYRAMDNAIYDSLKHRFDDEIRRKVREGELEESALRNIPVISLDDAPEVEHHRWVATFREYARGTERQRLRIVARPMNIGFDRWEVQVMVKEELYTQGNQFRTGSPQTFGHSPWVEMGRDARLEAAIANDVYARMNDWRAAGSPNPDNRRDEFLAGKLTVRADRGTQQ